MPQRKPMSFERLKADFEKVTGYETMPSLDEMEKLYPVDGITKLETSKLEESKSNKFKPITGEKWEQFLTSIRERGIHTPLEVRAIEGNPGKYEVIAGNNRLRAARELGLLQVPVIVKKCNDVEAMYIMADTNLQREYVSDLEQGWAYRNIYEAISRQGERTDLTSSHDGTKFRSDEIIAEKYGVGRNTVNRKIRLTYLVPELYEQFENKNITQEVAEKLSHLSEKAQKMVVEKIDQGATITPEQAQEISSTTRSMEATGLGFNITESIDEVLKGTPEAAQKEKPKDETRKSGKNYRIEDRFFPEGIKKKDRLNYIYKALAYILDNNISLEDKENEQ